MNKRLVYKNSGREVKIGDIIFPYSNDNVSSFKIISIKPPAKYKPQGTIRVVPNWLNSNAIETAQNADWIDAEWVANKK